MRVALVHDYLMQGMRGAERVLLTFHSIYPDAPIYTLLYDPASFGEALPDWEVHTSFLQPLRRLHKRLVWLMPRAIESLNLKQYDLVISSSSAWAKSAICGPQATHICYCYSPARFLWSWAEEYIDSAPTNIFAKQLLRWSLPYLRRWDARTASRPHYFVAISRTVQQRIYKYYGRQSTVIYPPVDTGRFAPSEVDEDYFLIVSALNPYKRVDLAVEAFNELRLPLKIIGYGPEGERLRRLAGPTVTLLGKCSDEEVAQRMARCRALVMPQEEDFGIVAVEAQAAGRPVIAYRAGGATETIVADQTGVFFNEQTPASLAEAVRRFAKMSFSKQQCVENAARFSTERFVRRWQEFVHSKLGDVP